MLNLLRATVPPVIPCVCAPLRPRASLQVGVMRADEGFRPAAAPDASGQIPQVPARAAAATSARLRSCLQMSRAARISRGPEGGMSRECLSYFALACRWTFSLPRRSSSRDAISLRPGEIYTHIHAPTPSAHRHTRVRPTVRD